MPVTIVAGGQYGSEGKGKVAAAVARNRHAAAVVRVGGPNSGHTPDIPGLPPLRQLPTAAYETDAVCVLTPGSYISTEVLIEEIQLTGLTPERLRLDPKASVVTDVHRKAEVDAGLDCTIGSTGSGTGAAVWRRVMRSDGVTLAGHVPELAPYLNDTSHYLRALIARGQRVVIEGTQGFGLSILHGGHYPYATSRDTTAAGALSEAGLSPLDVDDVILVIRAFPIRVAGTSGPLPNETTWEEITARGGHEHPLLERTTVTQRIRRVANFHPNVVLCALAANRPTAVVLNHLDYLDHTCCTTGTPTAPVTAFVSKVEKLLDRRIDHWGIGPDSLVEASRGRQKPSGLSLSRHDLSYRHQESRPGERVQAYTP